MSWWSSDFIFSGRMERYYGWSVDEDCWLGGDTIAIALWRHCDTISIALWYHCHTIVIPLPYHCDTMHRVIPDPGQLSSRNRNMHELCWLRDWHFNWNFFSIIKAWGKNLNKLHGNQKWFMLLTEHIFVKLSSMNFIIIGEMMAVRWPCLQSLHLNFNLLLPRPRIGELCDHSYWQQSRALSMITICWSTWTWLAAWCISIGVFCVCDVFQSMDKMQLRMQSSESDQIALIVDQRMVADDL